MAFRGSPAWRCLMVLLATTAVVVLVFAFDLVGALALHAVAPWFGAGASGGHTWVAVIAALVACVVVPAALDSWVTHSYRRLEADAPSTVVRTVLAWNALALVAAVLLMPHASRAALSERGGWVLEWAGKGASDVGARATRWMGRHIPRTSSDDAPPAPTAAPLASSSPIPSFPIPEVTTPVNVPVPALDASTREDAAAAPAAPPPKKEAEHAANEPAAAPLVFSAKFSAGAPITSIGFGRNQAARDLPDLQDGLAIAARSVDACLHDPQRGPSEGLFAELAFTPRLVPSDTAFRWGSRPTVTTNLDSWARSCIEIHLKDLAPQMAVAMAHDFEDELASHRDVVLRVEVTDLRPAPRATAAPDAAVRGPRDFELRVVVHVRHGEKE